MLKATIKPGKRAAKDKKDGNYIITSNDNIKPKLTDFDLSLNQSAIYQKLAAIPEETFEAALEESAKKRGIENHGCKIKPC